MTCPNCGRLEAEGVLECAGCGLVFYKWGARSVEPSAAAHPAGGGAPAAPAGGRALVLTLFLALAAGAWNLSQRPPRERAAGGNLDPELWRPALEQLDQRVYAEGPVSLAQAAALQAAAMTVVEGLRRTGGPEASRAALEIERLAERWGALGESSSPQPAARLDVVRDWELQRARFFRPAGWLISVSAGVPNSFEEAARQLEHASYALSLLIEQARGDWSTLDDPKGREGRSWPAWLELWRSRTDQGRTSLCAPELLPAPLQEAGRTLRRLARHLSTPPEGASWPTREERTDWLERAEGWLGQARVQLAAAQVKPQ